MTFGQCNRRALTLLYSFRQCSRSNGGFETCTDRSPEDLQSDLDSLWLQMKSRHRLGRWCSQKDGRLWHLMIDDHCLGPLPVGSIPGKAAGFAGAIQIVPHETMDSRGC